MDLLVWFSGVYIIYCIFSLVGLWKSGKASDFYADNVITPAVGFFFLASLSNNGEFTKESLGILAAMYGFIILVYGFLSYLIKTKNESGKSE